MHGGTTFRLPSIHLREIHVGCAERRICYFPNAIYSNVVIRESGPCTRTTIYGGEDRGRGCRVVEAVVGKLNHTQRPITTVGLRSINHPQHTTAASLPCRSEK